MKYQGIFLFFLQELKEEFTRILTANNPHAPQNIVRFNFKVNIKYTCTNIIYSFISIQSKDMFVVVLTTHLKADFGSIYYHYEVTLFIEFILQLIANKKLISPSILLLKFNGYLL